ncbi:uncharacterized protein LOC124148197 [Haliotis rufescens]|uniref:uncharacterized protein LOC124148197 n=1 Tax=Haliotis rufescens TaxID=6454 RepID=UPI00201E8FF1|nr:uncharacterized protein LOC124148197 [Haliotis rufescens]
METDVCGIMFCLASLLSGTGNGACLESMNMAPSSLYRSKKVSGSVKISKTVANVAECSSHCVVTGYKISFIFDPNTTLCTCHTLPLASLSLVPAAGAVAFGHETLPADVVDTWITSIIDFSSSYYSPFAYYGPNNMLGVADFYPEYGNTDKAWCPAHRNDAQYVELGISEPIYITEIHIYEVFKCGGVKSLSVRDPNSNWMVLWRTPAIELIETSRILIPNFMPPAFTSDAIRIDLDLGTANAWSEFDAVRVVGTRIRTRDGLAVTTFIM